MPGPWSAPRAAADDLVAVLREFDVEGEAFRRARRLARFLRQLERRSRAPSTDLVLGLDDRVSAVEAGCRAEPLRRIAPVRRALTQISLAWDDHAAAVESACAEEAD